MTYKMLYQKMEVGRPRIKEMHRLRLPVLNPLFIYYISWYKGTYQPHSMDRLNLFVNQCCIEEKVVCMPPICLLCKLESYSESKVEGAGMQRDGFIVLVYRADSIHFRSTHLIFVFSLSIRTCRFSASLFSLLIHTYTNTKLKS